MGYAGNAFPLLGRGRGHQRPGGHKENCEAGLCILFNMTEQSTDALHPQPEPQHGRLEPGGQKSATRSPDGFPG